MGSWKDRSTLVENKSAGGDWRSRSELAGPALKYGRRQVATGTPIEHEALPADADALEVSAPEAALVGAGGGMLFGYDDEVSAGVNAALDQIGERSPQLADPLDGSEPPQESFADAYRRNRDSNRDLQRRAQDQQPAAYFAGNVAGDALTQAALAGVTGGASLTPGGQFLVGSAAGAGRSQGDLLRGNAENWATVGTDAAVSGGLSAGLTAGANKLGGYLRDRAARGIAKAEADALAKATSAIDENIASAAGKFGSSVQAGSRALENVSRELPHVAPELQSAAREAMESGAVNELRNSVFENTLQKLPQHAGAAAAAKQAMQGAIDSREADIAAKASDLLSEPIKRQLLPRLKTYASRAIPPLVAAGTVSALGGGPAATALGAGLGFGASAIAGAPGTAIANAARHPAVRKLMWTAVQKTLATAPERLGAFARTATRIGSPELLDAVLSRDPQHGAEWERTKLELLNDYLAEQMPLEDDNATDD